MGTVDEVKERGRGEREEGGREGVTKDGETFCLFTETFEDHQPQFVSSGLLFFVLAAYF